MLKILIGAAIWAASVAFIMRLIKEHPDLFKDANK